MKRTMNMRTMTVIAALGLTMGACGGGDDASVDTPATASDPADEATEAEATEAESTEAESSEAESSEVESSEVESSEVATTEITGDDADSDQASADDGGTSIRSLDDIPERCRDLMAEFLREVEPIVSPIDWETATFSDFEAIGPEFDVESEAFDADFTEARCDDLDFVDNEFDLMVEFAESEAPGVVGYLRFLSAMGDAGVAGAGGEAGDGAFTSCADGVAFIQVLMDTYDSFADVPATELLKFMQLTALYPSCTPAELDFLDSDEVNAFLGQ